MTPEKPERRIGLDQIEPIIGDILRTQDEHTSQNKQILFRQDELSQQYHEVARLVIDLSVSQSRMRKELTDKIEKLETGQAELKTGQAELKTGQAELTMKVDLILKILQDRN